MIKFLFLSLDPRDDKMQESAARFFHRDFKFRYLKALQIVVWLQTD